MSLLSSTHLKKVSVLFLLFFSILPSNAQETNVDLIKGLYEKGRAFLDSAKYDSANVYFQKALASFTTKNTDTELHLKTRSGLNEINLRNRNLEVFRNESDDILKTLYTKFPEQLYEIGQQYMQQGLSYAYVGNLGKAEPLFIKSRDVFERVIAKREPNQNIDRTINAVSDVYNYLALVKNRTGAPDSSDYYYEKAVSAQQLSSLPDPLTMASSYYGISLSAYYQDHFIRAVEYAQKVTKVLNRNNATHLVRLSGAYLMLATCKQELFEIDSAIHFNSLALDISRELTNGRGKDLVSPLQTLAKMHLNIGDFHKAKTLLEEALQIDMEGESEANNLSAVLYNYLAEVVIAQDNALNEGLSYYDKALALTETDEEQAPQDLLLRLTINRKSAVIHLMKAEIARSSGALEVADSSFNEAIRRLNHALDLDEAMTRGEGASDVIILANMGEAYFSVGEYELAEKHLKEAIKRADAKPTIGKRETAKADALLTLAEIALLEKNFQSFHQYRSQCESVIARFPALTFSHQVESYNLMARSFLEQSAFDSAVYYAQKALDSNLVDPNSPATEPNNISYYQGFTTTISLLPQIYLAKYEEGKNLDDLKRAQVHSKQYIKKIIDLITEARDKNDLADQLAVYNREIQRGAYISHQLYKITGDEVYKEDAFAASQQSRSVILKTVTQGAGLNYAQVPKQVLAEAGKLDSRVTYYSGLLKTAQLNNESEEKIQDIKDKLFESKENVRLNRLMMEENHPEYFSFKFDNRTFTSEMIQGELSEGTTYLEFIDGEEEVLVFVISKTDFQLTAIPKAPDTDRIASNLIESLRTTENSEANLAALYNQYIAPVRPSLKTERLMIVPDGNLWNINFELLKSGEDSPFLIEEYSISYAYSANSLFKINRRGKTKKKILAYSFGKASNMAPSGKLFRSVQQNELPGSALEVHELSGITSGDFFYMEGASETSFKNRAVDYDIIHLAIHGEIDEFDYDRSRLYFNTDLADSINDGVLYPFELYNMDLNANLAVLSACNSGGGRISRGEGIMSLGRAFQYAGVNSLLLSKWEISDAVAPDIIVSFYQYIKEGMDKASALRAAKLDYLANADNITASPYYWGSFFILGDPEPISLKAGFDYTQVIIIFCLFIISASWAFRARMRKAQKNPDA